MAQHVATSTHVLANGVELLFELLARGIRSAKRRLHLVQTLTRIRAV